MKHQHPHSPDPRRDGMRCASCGEPSIHRFCDACSQHPAPDRDPEATDSEE